MWESVSEKEAYGELEKKRDKMALRGERKLKTALIIQTFMWLAMTLANISWENISLIIVIFVLLGVALYGVFTNRNIGFYSFVVFLILQFVINSVLSFKLVVMISALLNSSNNNKIITFVLALMIVVYIIAYCVTLKIVAFDDDVHAWRKFRKHRH